MRIERKVISGLKGLEIPRINNQHEQFKIVNHHYAKQSGHFSIR